MNNGLVNIAAPALRLLILGLWLAGSITVPALEANGSAESYSIQSWSTEQGLPSCKVREITEGSDGYLWVATAQGIARFDGSRFTVFSRANCPELRGGGFYCVRELRDGTLWFGGDGGMFRRRNGHFDHYTTRDGLPDDGVREFYLRRDGTLLICLRNGYAFMKDGRITAPSGAWKNVTGFGRSIIERRDGSVLLGTSDGLWEISAGGRLQLLSGTDNAVTSMTEATDGSVWIGSNKGLQRQFPDGRRADYGQAQGLADPRVSALCEDRDRNLWIGTSSGNLYCLTDGHVKRIVGPDQFGFTPIRQIYEDQEGALWIATATGMFRIKNNIGFNIGPAQGLAETSVYSILEADDGAWWIGLWSGTIYRYDHGKAVRMAALASSGMDAVFALAEEPAGTIWMGTMSGLYRDQDGTITNLYQRNQAAAWAASLAGHPGSVLPGLAHSRVNSIAPDKRGGIWAATDGALYHGNAGSFRVYTAADGLPGNDFESVICARNGDVWVTVPPAGVACRHDGRWTSYLCGKQISDVLPRAVFEDSTGAIWVTTEGGGLNRFKNGRWRPFTSRDGLADDYISGITEDDLGNLWITCPEGIMRIPLRQFDELDGGARTALLPRMVDQSDGLPSAEANASGSPNSCRTRDGRLLFGTDRGVTVIEPAGLKINPQPATLHVESAQVNGKDVDLARPLVLAPGQNNLQIHYTAISLLAAEKIRFKTRLDPLDNGWVEMGNRRDVRYDKLPAGHYTFHVTACNNDGIWNNDGVALAFVVRPHFYETLWFIGLALAAAGGTAFGLYRMNLRRAQQRHAVLKELVAERTQELQAAKDAAEHAVTARNDVIHDLRAAEARLARSLSLQHATLEATADGILVIDRSGRVVSYNSRFMEMWRLPREKIVPGQPDEVLPLAVNLVKNEQDFFKKIQELYHQPDADSFDVIELKDGRIFERHSQPQRLNDLCVGRVWSFRDVTENRRYQSALRESEANYQSLVHQLPAGVFRKGRDGRYVFVNAWFCRFKGIQPEDYLGKLPAELTEAAVTGPRGSSADAAELINAAADHHQQVMRTGRQIEREEKYTGADGKVAYFQSIKSPVFDTNGAVVGSQGILLDITQRKLAEAELTSERELLRTLLENSADSIYFKDRESRYQRLSRSEVKNLFRIAASRHQSRHPGPLPPYLADEQQFAGYVLGKSDADIYGDQGAAQFLRDEQEIIRTGRPMVGKIETILDADGHLIWYLTTKMPWHDNQTGEIIGTFGITSNITAIKDAEARVEQTQKQLLETSRQAGMAEVATSVLHNVGNVLNSVNVSTTLVLELIRKSRVGNLSRIAVLLREHRNELADFFTHDPRGQQLPDYVAALSDYLAEEQAGLIREIELTRSNIEHIKDIVAMQQSYARISGVVEKVKVTDLVEDALRMNAGALTRHSVEVIRDFPDAPIEIAVERQKVLQILINLIRNAKYACDDSARTDKRLTLAVRAVNHHIEITVADNGIGIPAENMTRIFNHGFTTRQTGHGFGLHSGALAARELGGALTAQSDGTGTGARFTLQLPLQPPEKK